MGNSAKSPHGSLTKKSKILGLLQDRKLNKR